jgi:hypothetical protein
MLKRQHFRMGPYLETWFLFLALLMFELRASAFASQELYHLIYTFSWREGLLRIIKLESLLPVSCIENRKCFSLPTPILYLAILK